MLNLFRQSANKGFMLLLLLVIGFVFVFTFGSWGGGNLGAGVPYAAMVNDKVVPAAQFSASYADAFRMQQLYRPGFDAEKAREEGLRQTVLDRLIDQELLAQAADDRGLTVSDDEVADLIQTRFFGKDKPFNADEYKSIVAGVYQTTPARYEQQVRREILAQRMVDVLAEAQHVSPTEVKETFDAKFDRANLDVVRIDPLHFKKTAPALSDDEAKKWAAEHEADVKAFYDKHINRYRQPKKVRARHILAKVAESASDEDKKKAREKIDAAKKRVDGGEDFAKVATEVSEDGSAKQGGDLGFFGPGAMVKPFEDAAFALQPGQVSDVVTSRFGYHVIKVEEVQEEQIKTLDDVKVDIAKQMAAETQQKAEAKKVAEQVLADLKAGTKPADLKVPGLVKAADLVDPATQKPEDAFAPRLDETGWFAKNARYVPKVGVAPDIVKAAFDLTAEAPVAPQVFEVQNRLYVVKLKEREKPDPARLADERESIEQGLVGQRRAKVVEEFTGALREKARVEKNEELFR